MHRLGGHLDTGFPRMQTGLTWRFRDAILPRSGLGVPPVRLRWRFGFVEDTRAWLPFSSLAEEHFPDGLHIATWSRDRGWHGYGARRRWDWTYAASLRQALESGDI